MFKNLDPQDIKVKPFKSFKNFTFTNNDSGSGVFLVKARSGSYKQYVSSSDAITHIISGSVTSSFFALPTWNMINKTFYKDSDKPFNHLVITILQKKIENSTLVLVLLM